MKRLLVITHTFPPSRHSNAKRPFYLVKGFVEAGWQVDVYTSHLAMEPGAAETLQHAGLRIFRCPDPVERRSRKLAGFPLLQKMFTLAAAGLMWPDYFAPWARNVIRACSAAGPYDRALAFVLPPSVLLTGQYPNLIGRHWLFDYQESVTPQYRRHPRRSPLQRRRLPRLADLERDTLHRAGKVVFTADTNRRAYIQEGLVPEAATAHIPYFYDAEAFRHKPATVLPGFDIVYFGTFDWRGARSPETFLRAFAKFFERQPAARDRARFVFYGTWLPEHNSLIAQLGLNDRVSLNPAVGYEQYLEKLKQSPLLLLVVSSAHNLFMPSKIVDYFGAGRPILAFVPRQSEMRQVLEKAGQAEFTCDESDVAAGATALERLWVRYQAGTLPVLSEQSRFWSSEVQLPRYLELLNS